MEKKQSYKTPREERSLRLFVCGSCTQDQCPHPPERIDHGFPGAEMLNPGVGDCVDMTYLLPCWLGCLPLTTAGPGTWFFLICRQEKQMVNNSNSSNSGNISNGEGDLEYILFFFSYWR